MAESLPELGPQALPPSTNSFATLMIVATTLMTTYPRADAQISTSETSGISVGITTESGSVANQADVTRPLTIPTMAENAWLGSGTRTRGLQSGYGPNLAAVAPGGAFFASGKRKDRPQRCSPSCEGAGRQNRSAGTS